MLRINNELLKVVRGLQHQLMVSDGGPSDKLIHRIRLATKRARAESVFVISGGEAKKLRRRAKQLSGLLSVKRDACVMLLTLDKIVPIAQRGLADYQRIKQLLHERYLVVAPTVHDLSFLLGRLAGIVKVSDVARNDKRLGCEVLVLAKLEMQQKESEIRLGHYEDYHDWRKAVKRYVFLMKVLKPKVNRKKILKLKMLGESLGELNDLKQLEQYLANAEGGANIELQSMMGEYQASLLDQIERYRLSCI